MTDYTYAEIDAMRAKLAKMWGQRIDQVTEDEARWYLRNPHDLDVRNRPKSCYRGTWGCLLNGNHHIVCKP